MKCKILKIEVPQAPDAWKNVRYPLLVSRRYTDSGPDRFAIATSATDGIFLDGAMSMAGPNDKSTWEEYGFVPASCDCTVQLSNR